VSHLEHKARAPASVRCFVLTVSDTRAPDTDTSGRAIAGLLRDAGHEVSGTRIVRDEPAEVTAAIREVLGAGSAQAIITTGGTGIGRRDSSFEAIDALLDKRLPGFGELFRMLSYQQIGAAAMLSRACAGTAGGVVIVALPGSEAAVRLAVTKLIVPELGHLVRELTK
jgi:molybdenum cofactor biosynthesis protein B